MNLDVEIPKRFKEQLEKRFDLRRFNLQGIKYINNTSCILCVMFRQDKCKNCPFNKFREGHSRGCSWWLNMVLKYSEGYLRLPTYSAYFRNENEEEAKQEIREIKKAAKKYIKWTP